MSRLRDQLREFRSADSIRKQQLCNEISKFLIAKLDGISNNWPDTNLSDLKEIALSLNPGYLSQILGDEIFELMTKSNLTIAIDRKSGKKDIKLKNREGVRCRGTRGEGKLLVENPYSQKFKLQVWSDWHEDENHIKKHLGNPTKNASTWSSKISRPERIIIEKKAIECGRAKFHSHNRIDFVFQNDNCIGHLKNTGSSCSYLRVELVRQPLKHKKHRSSFHGFPISKVEFQAF